MSRETFRHENGFRTPTQRALNGTHGFAVFFPFLRVFLRVLEIGYFFSFSRWRNFYLTFSFGNASNHISDYRAINSTEEHAFPRGEMLQQLKRPGIFW